MAGHGNYNPGTGGGASDIRNMDNLAKALNDPNFDTLKLDGVTVTSTAAELNILDGVNADAAEINTLQIDTKFTLIEDFHGTWLDTDDGPVDNWLVGIGNGTTPVKATTVANSLNGEVTMKSATSAGAGTAVNSMFTGANLGWKANQGGLAMEVRLKVDDIVETYIFVGFTDAIASTKNDPISFTDGSDTPISAAADACGLVFTGDSTTQEFHLGGVKNTADTAANFSGTAPVNNAYIILRVEVSAAGAVTGYIDGTAVAGGAVAAAITETVAVTPCIAIGNTASAQTIATVDYIWVQQNR